MLVKCQRQWCFVYIWNITPNKEGNNERLCVCLSVSVVNLIWVLFCLFCFVLITFSLLIINYSFPHENSSSKTEIFENYIGQYCHCTKKSFVNARSEPTSSVRLWRNTLKCKHNTPDKQYTQIQNMPTPCVRKYRNLSTTPIIGYFYWPYILSRPFIRSHNHPGFYDR